VGMPCSPTISSRANPNWIVRMDEDRLLLFVVALLLVSCIEFGCGQARKTPVSGAHVIERLQTGVAQVIGQACEIAAFQGIGLVAGRPPLAPLRGQSST